MLGFVLKVKLNNLIYSSKEGLRKEKKAENII
jgi:hypothetical protein